MFELLRYSKTAGLIPALPAALLFLPWAEPEHLQPSILRCQSPQRRPLGCCLGRADAPVHVKGSTLMVAFALQRDRLLSSRGGGR